MRELVVDLFAGGGGASEGMVSALGRDPDIAVNHWDRAITMHTANHADTRHYIEDVFAVNPHEATQGRPVGMLWLSPDCTHHSRARGGKPADKGLRALAWVAQKWGAAVRPRVIFLENVPEFLDWGPLDDATGLPIKERKGETFFAWRQALQRLGYQVEHRVLVAADYGAPTTRKRLFLIARCDGQPIVWPEPSHGPDRAHPWRTAAEIIDWTVPVRSIFGRKKPLADPTLRRIAVGMQRFVIDTDSPYILPVGTELTAPYLTNHFGQSTARPLTAPAPTVVAGAVHAALVAPTLIQTGYGERVGQTPRALDIKQPLGTVVAGGGRHALVATWLAKHFGSPPPPAPMRAVGQSMDRPVGTVTTQDHHALMGAFLTKFYGTSTGSGLDAPVPTVTAGGEHLGAVAALLERFVPGTQPFVRWGGELWTIADVGMRMLTPRELFTAQGFRPDYAIELLHKGKALTKKDQIALAGNSVPPQLAAALVAANYQPRTVGVAA